MADIFALLILDRHSDPEIRLFRDPENAIEAAEDFLEGMEEVERFPVDGCLFNATYSCEGDYVSIQAVNIEDDNG